MCNKNKPQTNCTNETRHQELITLLQYQNTETNKRIEQLEHENAQRFDKILQKLEQYTQQQIQTQKDVISLTEKIKVNNHRINDLEEQREKDSTFLKSIAVVVIAQIIIAVLTLIDLP